MLICPYCNEENYESNTTCWKCGAVLNKPDPVALKLEKDKPVLSLTEEYCVLMAGRNYRELLLNINLVGILRIIAGGLQLLSILLLWGTFEALAESLYEGAHIIVVLLGITGVANIIIGVMKINPEKDPGTEIIRFIWREGNVGLLTVLDYFWNAAIMYIMIWAVGLFPTVLAATLLLLMAILTDIYKVKIFEKSRRHEIQWYLEHKE